MPTTTQEKIVERLQLLPESMLREVLLFIDFLLSRLSRSSQFSRDSEAGFADALARFRTQVDAEGSDIEEVDFFSDVRDRTLTSEEARW